MMKSKKLLDLFATHLGDINDPNNIVRIVETISYWMTVRNTYFSRELRALHKNLVNNQPIDISDILLNMGDVEIERMMRILEQKGSKAIVQGNAKEFIAFQRNIEDYIERLVVYNEETSNPERDILVKQIMNMLNKLIMNREYMNEAILSLTLFLISRSRSNAVKYLLDKGQGIDVILMNLYTNDELKLLLEKLLRESWKEYVNVPPAALR